MNDTGIGFNRPTGLPKGWSRTRVDKCVRSISLTGKKLPQRQYREAGSIPVVDQGQQFVGGYTDSRNLLVDCEPPVIIFGDHTRILKFIPFRFVAGADGVKVLKPLEKFNPKLLYYFLQAVVLPNKGYARHYQFLEKAEIPIPPMPEQERILSRIEELFSDLDAGVAALERVRAGLKQLRRSLVDAGVGGTLLGDGRIRTGTAAAPSWPTVRLEVIAGTIGGVTKGRNFRGRKTIMLPYLRVANVQRGFLDLHEMKEIELAEAEVDRYRLQDGDVVLTEGGDWDKLGRAAIWRGQIELCVHQNHIFRARLDRTRVLSEWLMFCSNSEYGRRYFVEASKQTTNLASINLTQLRAFPVPLPPIEAQRNIVAEVERRISVVQHIETATEMGLARAARLRQTVLRAAFEGRL